MCKNIIIALFIFLCLFFFQVKIKENFNNLYTINSSFYDIYEIYEKEKKNLETLSEDVIVKDPAQCGYLNINYTPIGKILRKKIDTLKSEHKNIGINLF